MNSGSSASVCILIVAALILVTAVINRTFRWPGQYIHGEGARLTKLYVRVFWPAILFIAAGIISWILVPNSVSPYRDVLLATFLGVGASIFIAEGLKKLTEHK